ncbi:dipeptide ABC transporter, substrate-binding protein [Escherichia coli]|uniref:Dipeptide ABC transporter, substrate-binding protein n=1 Tax=Escherichia coli TaxID=562 RepID=A0A376KIY3_ECOLX|nr:dipeptide ABC transporter, substrate-binding protein [Escherichia coli]
MTWCSRSIVRKTRKNPYHKVSGGSYEYFEGMGLPELISEVKKVDDNTVQFVLTRRKRRSSLIWQWTSPLFCQKNMLMR